MKPTKKVGILSVLALVLLLSTIAVYTGNTEKETALLAEANVHQENQQTGEEIPSGTIAGAELMMAADMTAITPAQATDNVTAGVAAVFGESLEFANIQKSDTVVVAESAEPAEPSPEEIAKNALEQEWSDKLMADIETQMNVRQEPSAESGIVGRLHKGDLATILSDEGEWIQITSGNVTGYVAKQYCVTGMEAYEYAMTNCHTMATSTVGGLRIRNDMSTEAGVVKTLAEGDEILVDTIAQVDDGWVAVLYKKQTCYVSADYVTLELSTGKALTLEEEAEIERKKKEAEAAAKSKQVSSAGTVSGSALASSVDDVTLLAALISCEGGNQVYDCQLAVGAVVVNRVKSGRYPNSLAEVIYQRGQFGPATNGALSRKLSGGGINETSWAAAQAALNGETNVGAACSFKLVSSGHEGIAIGAFVFY